MSVALADEPGRRWPRARNTALAMIKFLAHGTGSAASAADYLTREMGFGDHEREFVEKRI